MPVAFVFPKMTPCPPYTTWVLFLTFRVSCYSSEMRVKLTTGSMRVQAGLVITCDFGFWVSSIFLIFLGGCRRFRPWARFVQSSNNRSAHDPEFCITCCRLSLGFKSKPQKSACTGNTRIQRKFFANLHPPCSQNPSHFCPSCFWQKLRWFSYILRFLLLPHPFVRNGWTGLQNADFTRS